MLPRDGDPSGDPAQLSTPGDPAQLPPPGDPARWPWLQQLRRRPQLELAPWLTALEAGSVPAEADLLTVLAERVDSSNAPRLLAWWLRQDPPDPALGERIGRRREASCAALLRQALARAPQQAPLLLPLLGHQRDPADAALLSELALAPGPAAQRRAALEGLAVGLSSWPLPALRRTLAQLAADLDPQLAADAVDLLARLPRGRALLLGLAADRLDPAVAARRQRRLHALPPSPLLLLVHGRSGGLIPDDLLALRDTLEQRRGASVRLLALTAAEGSPHAPLPPRPQGPEGATLVPLFLVPGGHVRHDLPAIAAHWRQAGPLHRLPFLGAWRCWQQALTQEVQELGQGAAAAPLLLHHPLNGALGRRYLQHLSRITGAACRPASYSAPDPQELQLAIRSPVLALALAANRLTDSLPLELGPPLLQRPRLQRVLLEQLAALP